MTVWLALPTPTQSQFGSMAWVFLIVLCLMFLAGARK